MNDPLTDDKPTKRNLRAAKRYPELSLFPNDEARQTALRRADNSRSKSSLFWILAVAFGALMVIATAGIAVEIGFRRLPLPPYVRTLPFSLFASGVCLFVLTRATRHLVRRSLRLQLQQLEIPVCLHCGYDLRGQLDPRCPECGRPFDPALLKHDDT